MEKDLQKGWIASISSKSSKIHLLIKVLYMSSPIILKNYLYCADGFLVHTQNIVLAVQRYRAGYEIFQLCRC